MAQELKFTKQLANGVMCPIPISSGEEWKWVDLATCCGCVYCESIEENKVICCYEEREE